MSEITHKSVLKLPDQSILHACNYTQLPRSSHALSMNTTCRLQAFYVRVGAAIPLAGTVITSSFEIKTKTRVNYENCS